MRVVKDIPYLTSARYADNKDTLDIYVPEGKAGARAPVIVWYYGGALTQGDKSDATEAGAGSGSRQPASSRPSSTTGCRQACRTRRTSKTPRRRSRG